MMGEAIRNIVDGLKASPVLLVILLLNVALVGGLGYFLLKYGEANSARMNMILQACLPRL
jgi:hypothetical protein